MWSGLIITTTCCWSADCSADCEAWSCSRCCWVHWDSRPAVEKRYSFYKLWGLNSVGWYDFVCNVVGCRALKRMLESHRTMIETLCHWTNARLAPSLSVVQLFQQEQSSSLFYKSYQEQSSSLFYMSYLCAQCVKGRLRVTPARVSVLGAGFITWQLNQDQPARRGRSKSPHSFIDFPAV